MSAATGERAAVLLVGADVGCLEILLPLYERLEARYVPYLCLPPGSLAAERAPSRKRRLDPTELGSLPERHARFACVVSTPGKSQDLVRLVSTFSIAQGAPTALVETIHLSSCYGGLGDLPADLLITLDGFACDLLARRLAERAPVASLAALGHPAFDDLEARLDERASAAAALRRQAGLADGAPVIGFFASASSQADPSAVLSALRDIRAAHGRVELLFFAHPVDREPAAAWRGTEPSRLEAHARDADEITRLALCDIVLTQFSTVGAKALYARRPAVFALTGGAEAHMACNGRLPFFEALHDSGAAAVAYSRDELRAALERLIAEPARRRAMIAQQRAYFPAITGSADRMAAAVGRLLAGER